MGMAASPASSPPVSGPLPSLHSVPLRVLSLESWGYKPITTGAAAQVRLLPRVVALGALIAHGGRRMPPPTLCGVGHVHA